MTKDDNQQEDSGQCNCKCTCNCQKGKCSQDHYKQTCIELAKHTGVLSVGLSFILLGIVMQDPLSPWTLFPVYISMVSILLSFFESIAVISIQLPSYIIQKSSIKDLNRTIDRMRKCFIVGVYSCFAALIIACNIRVFGG